VLILGSCWRLIGSWTVDPVHADQMALGLLIPGSWVLVLGSCWRLIGSWTVDPVPADQMALGLARARLTKGSDQRRQIRAYAP
jgi:hypothetical protein